ncbi:MAG TPA: hypothetical protein VL371_23660 [Gemmataceae bacterium]|nr:hypothetical protein [Gemmataceae bacterium]
MSWEHLRSTLLRGGVPFDLFEPIQESLTATAPRREESLRRLAAAVQPNGGNGSTLARLFAALIAEDAHARALALELAAYLPPLDASLIEPLRPLLRDRRLPAAARLEAAVAMTRTTGPSGLGTIRILRDFAAGVGKSRALERTGALRRRFGHLPAFGPFLAYLRRKVKLRCPRCRAKLPRRGMVRHMWDEHGVLLVGRNLTTPWTVIDAWGGADPERGLLRLHRWLLSNEVSDPEAGEHLRDAASREGASLCPACFALTPLPTEQFPDPAAIRPLVSSHGRLAADGYVVEVAERGLYPRLSIQTPRGVIVNGREPGGALAHHAAVCLAVVPWVVLAVALALLAPSGVAPLSTAVALSVAFFVRYLLQLRPQSTADPTDRALAYAWSRLVPRLHINGYDDDDAAFLARLAVTSIGSRGARSRDAIVQRHIATTAAAVRAGHGRLIDLAPLVRLSVADARGVGGDPVVRLADALWPCLTGDAPAGLAELVATDELMARWSVGRRARLRVLLTARAFEAGMEVTDLHDFGRAAPALGKVLDSDDLDGLARLRLLWSLRPTRPWQVCGPAATVFEVANYPMLGSHHLDIAPDLLLFQSLTPGGPEPPAPLIVSGRGLLYRSALVHDPDTPIDSRRTPGGYELIIGRQALPCRADPEDLARKLRRWTAYYFKEFLADVEAVLRRRSADVERLLRPLTVTCPKCGTQFLGRRGRIGERL